MGVEVPDVLTSDADDSDDAVCVGVAKDAGGEGTGVGCAAVGVVLGAGDDADAVVNYVVDGVDVEPVVCASGGGTAGPVQLNYCPWY